MESMRVGGLMSGLDTNAIIDSYMETAKAPIVKLNQQIDELTFEKTTYNNILSMLTDINNSLLPLKMENTFKSKTTLSSKSDVAAATASVNTPPGSYTVKVTQTAEAAYASSIYTNKVLSSAGAGVTSFSQAALPYDQQEGTHTVDIYQGSNYGYNDKWFAKDTFKSNLNNTYMVNHAGKASKTLVNGDGNLSSDVKGNFLFIYEYNGEQKSFSIDMDYAKGTSLNKIAADLETEINAKIDKLHTNNGQQSVRVTLNVDDNGFNFSFYDVDSGNNIEILGFIDPADPANLDKNNPNYKDPVNDPTYTPTASTVLINNLGINATYKSEAVKEITNIMVSHSSDLLGQKLNSEEHGGFFTPGKLSFDETTGLTEGTFKIYQDASANCRPATYTTFYGNTFKAIKEAATEPAKEDLEKWLNTKMSNTSAYFDTKPDEELNGYFYINNVKIEIEDYTKLTPNELMAKVNGSGAGVTMTFDYANKIFKIENNDSGSKELTLGNNTDTSNFFSVFKVGMTSGATYVRGQNSGNIDVSSVISGADTGYTYPVKSGTFTINGISIYVDVDKDTTEDVIKKINNSGAGVTMAYDSNTDKFSLTSTSGERIKVGGAQDTSTFLLATGLLYMQTSEQEIGSEGKNAVFTVNGIKYERQSNEASDIIPGMTFNLISEGTTVITVKTDTDKAVKALADFSAAYNKLINALNPAEIAYNDDLRDKYSEPLTDAKKETMSEDEIKKYQENYEKIQYYDLVTKSSEIRTLKQNLRAYLTKTIMSENTLYKTITEVGMKIAGSDTRDTSVTKLGLLFDVSTDPEKLAEYIKGSSDFASILEKDPDGVYAFFADTKKIIEKDEKGKETTKLESVGWARIYSDFISDNSNSSSALYKKTSSSGTIESQISLLKKDIETQTSRAEMYLERLWAQFAAMEEKVGTMQNNASYLTNLSAGGSSGS